MTDRKIMILIVGAIGVIALLGEIVLLWRILDALNDSQVSGTELAVMVGAAGGLGALVTGVIGWFAPSPLSKTTAADEPMTVVGPGGGPIETVDAEAGHADTALITCVCLVVIAIVAVLYALGELPL